MKRRNILSCCFAYLVSRCQAGTQDGENADNTQLQQQQEECIKSEHMESVPNTPQIEETLTYYSIRLKLEEWETPNFVYTPYLNLQSHSEVLRADLQGMYTMRHFWNHVSIFRQVLPFTGQFVFFEQALHSLAKLLHFGCVLMQIYSNERRLWGDVAPDCILDLFARNYLVMIITYLTFLRRFDNQQLVREGSAMYNLLTDYNRFVTCGTRNSYENALAHADRLFRQSFTFIPV
ncbi:MAG: hypothetical protein EOP45_18915 [Sphingobacteriaceae bacterium]|nr:MAG: hypothetical protein EOP45_18915 [Sphingobacteriaceae bacterium]